MNEAEGPAYPWETVLFDKFDTMPAAWKGKVRRYYGRPDNTTDRGVWVSDPGYWIEPVLEDSP